MGVVELTPYLESVSSVGASRGVCTIRPGSSAGGLCCGVPGCVTAFLARSGLRGKSREVL